MKNYQADTGQAKIRNPNIESRNKFKTRKIKMQNPKRVRLEFSAFFHLKLFRILDFELRIYFYLACFAPLRECLDRDDPVFDGEVG
jgi:hypothetical protein